MPQRALKEIVCSAVTTQEGLGWCLGKAHRQTLAGLDPPKEVSSNSRLHCQAQMGWCEEDFLELDDIGMLESRVIVEFALDIHCDDLWVPWPELDGNLRT